MTTLPHVRVTASGTLGPVGATDEIWSCSTKVMVLSAGAPVAPSAADLAAILPGAGAGWSRFLTGPEGTAPAQATFSSWATLTAVSVSAVLATGRQDPAIETQIAEFLPGSTGAGDVGNVYCQTPYQVSLCVTLHGGLYGRGSAAYGRFYPPVPNLHYSPAGPTTNMNAGLVAPSVALNMATEAALMLQGFSGAALAAGKTSQLVNIGASADAAGLRWQPVTAVTVDSRPDTIRRRYNSLSGRGKQSAGIAA